MDLAEPDPDPEPDQPDYGDGGDVCVQTGPGDPDGVFILETRGTFFRRLWFLLSAPLRYLFTGKIKL